MAITTTTGLLEALRKQGLLTATQVDEIGRSPVGRGGDPKELAYEIVRRGWLTQYQIKQVWNGRGEGLVLGQYLLLEPLGEGGMGQVFKAKHRSLGRTVALKVIRQDRLSNPAAIQRFQREIRAVSQLSHPNVVLAYDADQIGDRQIFAMEYAEGSDLARTLKERGPLPVGQACEYARQTALGLQHAHERGLVHRDIKPSNLLVSNGVVKILDMGLSRLREGPEGGTIDATLTQDGHVVGTPDYLPPEQARDSHSVDVRADIYSLGCTLYQMLTGSVPFPGGSPMEKVFKHQLEEPTPIEQRRPDLPKGLPAVVRKMMAKAPEQRYQTPEEVALALGPFARLDSGPATAIKAKKRQTKPPVIDPPRRASTTTKQDVTIGEATAPRRGRRWLLVGLAGGLLLSLGCVSLLALGWINSGTGTSLTGPGSSGKSGSSREPMLGTDTVAVIGDPTWRHWGIVTSLAASADGKRVASGGSDNAVRIWDRDTGKEAATCWGHEQPVLAVAFSPDGQTVASGSADHTVRLWNTATGAEVAALKGHPGEVIAVAFAPDGKTVASGGADRTVILWDVAGRRQRVVLQHTGGVRSLAFSADGKMLAAAAVSGRQPSWEVRFWDVEQAKALFAVPFPETHELFVAFAPTGNLLAVGNQTSSKQGNGNLGMYDTAKRETVIVHKENGPVRGVAFSADGKTLYAAVNDTVKAYNVGPKLRQRGAVSAEPGRPIVCLALAGKTVIVGQADSVIAVGEDGGSLKGGDSRFHRGPVNGIAVAADGKTLASVANVDGQLVRLWTLPGGQQRANLVGHQGWINGVTFTPDGRVAAWGASGVSAWNTAGQKLFSINNPNWNTAGAVLSTDGKSLVLLNQTETVKLHDFQTGKELAVLTGHTEPITVAVFSPDGQTLLTGSADRTIRNWDVAGRNVRGSVVKQPGTVTALTFSGDGKVVAGAFAANTESDPADVKLWDFASGKELAALGKLPTVVTGLACAPAGKPVVLWGQNFVKVWEGGQDLWSPLDGVKGAPRAAALSHDGKLLALATENRLLVKDLGSRKNVLDTAVPGPIGGLAFSPDDKTLYTANGNGTMYVVRVGK
jgi:WD40 repeat protein/serine/threonine protein kinase